ncbi:DUF1493 family protein [Chitinophaga sp. S165]|uniref:DUF1493 family protein n=1 Tax=Chitinophaga sp. S165 TaxID=2135462 RepID=UPI000D70E5FD|nr:DUF1493 family protein [Chitinophaga sp. S165]PWV56382.1 uncharacterized protein DUF1493 [Chitinophaga sp. S165]
MTKHMYELSQILHFVKDQTGADEIFENSDINQDLGCDGDDFDELINKFSTEFNVDLSTYLWYFHSAEEGNNIGGAIFPPPNERVKHIPVTPLMLLEFAQKGKWDLKYPEHQIPKRRYDLITNLIIIIVVFSLIIYKCASR